MRKVGGVVLEGLLVTAIGVGLAFAANHKSPRGLDISKDYFKTSRAGVAGPGRGNGPSTKPGNGSTSKPGNGSVSMPGDGSTPVPPTESETDKQIKTAGFKPIHYEEVVRLYKDDANYKNGTYLFIDAREETQYREGHIPLAWRIDHVKSKEAMETEPLKFLLPSAEKLILYCNGGNCEDSLEVAGDLRDARFDRNKIYVYAGGFTEWEAKKQPIEKGERESGQMVNGGGQ